MAFWGLKLEPGKRYSTTVANTFHVTKAVLELNNSDPETFVSVMLQDDSNSYILCHLHSKNEPQTDLDLSFATGDRITLFCKGKGVVHLSGYMVNDDDDFARALDEEETVDDSEVESVIPNKSVSKIKPLQKQDKSLLEAKRKKESISTGDDSDDSDFDLESSEEDEQGEVEEEKEDEEEEAEIPPLKKKQKMSSKQQQNGAIGTKEDKKKGQTQKKVKEDSAPGKKTPETKKEGNKVLSGGVIVKDLKVGSGPTAQPGKKVVVYYTGRLKSNNAVVDSCEKGGGFKFLLGKGEVIKGWDVGVAGMKVGGKRVITCPPQMAYGSKGAPPDVPPNSSMVFIVQLKAVN